MQQRVTVRSADEVSQKTISVTIVTRGRSLNSRRQKTASSYLLTGPCMVPSSEKFYYKIPTRVPRNLEEIPTVGSISLR